MTTSDAFLLTFNPNYFDLDADLLADWIEATEHGFVVEWNWATGGTKRKIQPGARVYLLQQGAPVRGIFASGTTVSEIYQESHWSGSGTLANYVDVKWDAVIDPEDALPTDALQAELPEGKWNPRSGGTQIAPAVVAPLARIWREHLSAVRAHDPMRRSAVTTHPSVDQLRRQQTLGGQGYGRKVDVRLRKQIENLAQERLTEFFVSDGWEVEDMRRGNPFDARATKGDEVMYLEAKGTVTSGKKVIVTRNEVAFAREHPGRCVMGVLSGIEKISSAEVDPSSGVLSLYRWDGQDEALAPLQFDFHLSDDFRL